MLTVKSEDSDSDTASEDAVLQQKIIMNAKNMFSTFKNASQSSTNNKNDSSSDSDSDESIDVSKPNISTTKKPEHEKKDTSKSLIKTKDLLKLVSSSNKTARRDLLTKILAKNKININSNNSSPVDHTRRDSLSNTSLTKVEDKTSDSESSESEDEKNVSKSSVTDDNIKIKSEGGVRADITSKNSSSDYESSNDATISTTNVNDQNSNINSGAIKRRFQQNKESSSSSSEDDSDTDGINAERKFSSLDAFIRGGNSEMSDDETIYADKIPTIPKQSQQMKESVSEDSSEADDNDVNHHNNITKSNIPQFQEIVKENKLTTPNISNSISSSDSESSEKDFVPNKIPTPRKVDKPESVDPKPSPSKTSADISKNIELMRSCLSQLNLSEVSYVTNFTLADLGSNEEVYILQCPVDVNPQDFLNKKILFSGSSTLKLGEKDYECYVENDTQNDLPILASEYSNSSELQIKIIEQSGTIMIKEALPQNAAVINSPTEAAPVPLPKGLKIRHSLFGAQFKEKVNIGAVIGEKLKEADEVQVKVNRKLKKKKKKRKSSASFNDIEFGNNALVELLNTRVKTEPQEKIKGKHKMKSVDHLASDEVASKKKKIKSVEESETLIDTEKSHKKKKKHKHEVDLTELQDDIDLIDSLWNASLIRGNLLDNTIAEGEHRKKKKKSKEKIKHEEQIFEEVYEEPKGSKKKKKRKKSAEEELLDAVPEVVVSPKKKKHKSFNS